MVWVHGLRWGVLRCWWNEVWCILSSCYRCLRLSETSVVWLFLHSLQERNIHPTSIVCDSQKLMWSDCFCIRFRSARTSRRWSSRAKVPLILPLDCPRIRTSSRCFHSSPPYRLTVTHVFTSLRLMIHTSSRYSLYPLPVMRPAREYLQRHRSANVLSSRHHGMWERICGVKYLTFARESSRHND